MGWFKDDQDAVPILSAEKIPYSEFIMKTDNQEWTEFLNRRKQNPSYYHTIIKNVYKCKLNNCQKIFASIAEFKEHKRNEHSY